VKIVEIAFTCYPVTDLKRACKFYTELLGLKESRRWGDENNGWVEYDIGAGTLAIDSSPPDLKPSRHGGLAGLEVDDFDAAIAQLKAAGVTFVWGPQETPVCFAAVISDPDGNSIFIHKRK
jgi:predicted enzyme related to lactoylglutathione lyase